MLMSATLIAKEEIPNYRFINAELDNVVEITSKLSSAQRLGNEFKSKTELTFLTEDGLKKVETTVWSLIDNYIQLKGGLLVPISSLVEVKF